MKEIDELLILIKQTREEKGISQKELAKHLGISQPAYNNIESGATALKVETLFQIASFLGIDFFPNPNNNKTEDLITVNPVDIAKKLNKIDEIDNNVRDLNSKIDKLFDFFKGGDGKKKK
jgi:transcriptional regulator with XRE-family HTH domain